MLKISLNSAQTATKHKISKKIVNITLKPNELGSDPVIGSDPFRFGISSHCKMEEKGKQKHGRRPAILTDSMRKRRRKEQRLFISKRRIFLDET